MLGRLLEGRGGPRSGLIGSTVRINEIFHSIQGESTHAGRPCVFVRVTGCALRCVWCDTTYAYHEGTDIPLADVLAKVLAYRCRLVEVTGGEPLESPEVPELVRLLLENGCEVLIETGGHKDISVLDPRSKPILATAKASGSRARRVPKPMMRPGLTR